MMDAGMMLPPQPVMQPPMGLPPNGLPAFTGLPPFSSKQFDPSMFQMPDGQGVDAAMGGPGNGHDAEMGDAEISQPVLQAQQSGPQEVQEGMMAEGAAEGVAAGSGGASRDGSGDEKPSAEAVAIMRRIQQSLPLESPSKRLDALAGELHGFVDVCGGWGALLLVCVGCVGVGPGVLRSRADSPVVAPACT